MTADPDRLKRLYFRSMHRGCKETDMLLGGFAQRNLASLSPDMLDLYEELLEEPDWDIWHWVTGDKECKLKYAYLVTQLQKNI